MALMWILMTDNLVESKSAAKMVTEKQQEIDAYAMLAKIRKQRIEIQKEMIALDSKLGLDPSLFFRNRRTSNSKH
jgi:hypothetical protein